MIARLGNEVVLPLDGSRLRLDLREMHDLKMYLAIQRDGAYEAATTEVLKRMLRPGDTFVDIGANNGYFSLIASRLVGEDGSILAVEPNPSASDRLRQNLKLNELDRSVRVFQLALGASEGRGVLFDTPFDDGWSYLTPRPPRDHSVAVEVRTLDSILIRPRALVLKVDTEGSELSVLKGAAHLFETVPNVAVVLEWNYRHATPQLWEYVRSRFTVRIIGEPPSRRARLEEVRSYERLRHQVLTNLLLTAGSEMEGRLTDTSAGSTGARQPPGLNDTGQMRSP